MQFLGMSLLFSLFIPGALVDTLGTLQQLFLPLGNLVWMHVKLPGELTALFSSSLIVARATLALNPGE